MMKQCFVLFFCLTLPVFSHQIFRIPPSREDNIFTEQRENCPRACQKILTQLSQKNDILMQQLKELQKPTQMEKCQEKSNCPEKDFVATLKKLQGEVKRQSNFNAQMLQEMQEQNNAIENFERKVEALNGKGLLIENKLDQIGNENIIISIRMNEMSKAHTESVELQKKLENRVTELERSQNMKTIPNDDLIKSIKEGKYPDNILVTKLDNLEEKFTILKDKQLDSARATAENRKIITEIGMESTQTQKKLEDTVFIVEIEKITLEELINVFKREKYDTREFLHVLDKNMTILRQRQDEGERATAQNRKEITETRIESVESLKKLEDKIAILNAKEYVQKGINEEVERLIKEGQHLDLKLTDNVDKLDKNVAILKQRQNDSERATAENRKLLLSGPAGSGLSHPSYNLLLQTMLQKSVPKSCWEWEQLKPGKMGKYLIDPDGVGGESAFEVYCDMAAGYTIISLTSPGNKIVEPCAGLDCYSMDMQYNATDKQIAALMKNSEGCRQSIKIQCRDSPLHDAWWLGSDGRRHHELAGLENKHQCLCGHTSSCISSTSHKCNCDAKIPGKLLTDVGKVTNMSALPIRKMVFGSQGTPLEIQYTIRELECYGKASGIKFPESCSDLKLDGYSNSGYYFVGAPDNPKLLHCDMEAVTQKYITLPLNQNIVNLIQNNTNLIKEKYEVLHAEMKKTENDVAFNAVSKRKTKFQAISRLILDHVTVNKGNAYVKDTGRFVAPSPGIYAFAFHGNTRILDNSKIALIRKNGVEIARTLSQGNALSDTTLGMSVVTHLETGDIVDVLIRQGVFDAMGSHLVFMGFKLF